MSRRFTRIPTSTFDELQVEAGLLLKNFDPSTGDFADDDILTATTGGITLNIKPTYSDYGDDVDNCPTNTKELKMIDDIEVSVSTTAINISENNIMYMLGAADKDAVTGAIKPRKTLKMTDFKDIWYVGDLANGGFVAMKISNALSTDGFSLKTTKKGKGNFTLTLTGHFSISNVDEVPCEIYLGEASDDDASITFSTSALNLEEGETKILEITYSPSSLAEYAQISMSGTGVSGLTANFSSDKKYVIVEGETAGKSTLTVASGDDAEASCEITVVAST